jgi:hypothetical protein
LDHEGEHASRWAAVSSIAAIEATHLQATPFCSGPASLPASI